MTSIGQFMLRLPASLHHALKERAAEEGVSLNQLVATLLAGAIQFQLAEPKELSDEDTVRKIERLRTQHVRAASASAKTNRAIHKLRVSHVRSATAKRRIQKRLDRE